MPVTGFLDDPFAGVQDCSLTLNLVAHCTLDRTEGVDVLGLGTGTQRSLWVRTQRQVDVRTDVTALHACLGNLKRTEDIAQSLNVGASNLRCTLPRTRDWAGHDFNQRDARTVVVDERVLGALNTTGSATHVGVLTSVLFHVGTLDVHAEDGAVLELHVEVTVIGDRLVVLRSLEVLGHVWVEVVLASKAARLSDLAVERQADLDRVLNGGAVHYRKSTRKPE